MSDTPRCPRCGSTNTGTSVDYKIKKGLGYAAEFGIGFLAGRYLGEAGVDLAEDISIADGVDKEWQCNDCGHIWRGTLKSSRPNQAQLGTAKPQNTSKSHKQQQQYNASYTQHKAYNKQDRAELLKILYKCDGRGSGWNDEYSFIQDVEHLQLELQKCSINISKSKVYSVNSYKKLADIILDGGWTYTAYAASYQPVEVTKLPSDSQENKMKAKDVTINHNEEQEYLEELKECLEDGELGGSERRLLNKLRIKLGISEERAAELEASLQKPQLTEEEQEYLEAYKDALEDGVVSEKERRLLDKLMKINNISEERAKEIEMLNK